MTLIPFIEANLADPHADRSAIEVRLPEPMMSRCTLVRLAELSIPRLIGVADRTGRERGLSDASIFATTEPLDSRGTQTGSPPNLRTVLRMLDRAAALEHKPMVM
ncbi:MAG: hypothetical protein Q4F71_00515 [Paracoccus sp. (in: a-proteobacteria)]|nr:hypothetical protein [Paracoccus sp. (in: a-proteobacteria)]